MRSVIKCILKQILGIKDVTEVMLLPKIDVIFFSSSQKLTYSSSFQVREYFSQ